MKNGMESLGLSQKDAQFKNNYSYYYYLSTAFKQLHVYNIPSQLILLLCPRTLGRGIKQWCCLTSVVYIGPKSRTEA